MKKIPNPNRFYSSSHLLLSFLAVLLGGGVLLLGLTAISKTFAARIGSPQAEPSSQAVSSKNDPVTNSGPAHRLDEQGNRPATRFAAARAQTSPSPTGLEMEPGPRSDRRAATCSMLLFRPLLQVSLSLGSHPMAAWVARFIAQVTVAIYGLRCWLCRAQVFSTSSLLPPAQRTLALRTASDEVRITD